MGQSAATRVVVTCPDGTPAGLFFAADVNSVKAFFSFIENWQIVDLLGYGHGH
jgi:hypothetical protein